MTIVSLIISLVSVGLLIFVLYLNKRLEQRLIEREGDSERLRQQYETESQRIRAEAQSTVDAVRTEHQAETERLRQLYNSETQRIRAEAEGSLAKAQAVVDQQAAEMKQELERVREHYQAQARAGQAAAEALVARTLRDVEPLRKYEGLREPEAEVRRLLSQALEESTALRKEARDLLGRAHEAASQQRVEAQQHAKELNRQAEALLRQATLDAGRVVSDAEKRAEQIAGDAYETMRDKKTLEQAVQALWNTVEGYGDRYVVPTRSLLDELAEDFGHTEAGEALRTARQHSTRMVELKEASSCNYQEPDRRDRANRFVVDAFNGRVEAILSRVKHNNYGTLAQEIRDAFSLVNLNGVAFRDARILPAYLDARLAELKWAAVVQELKLQEREEQQRIREQMRDEEKARREYDRAMREAALQKEMFQKAMEEAQVKVQQASAEQKAFYERQLAEVTTKWKEAEEKNQRAMSMAQQTRRGHVYIVSNIGSFGENVYKIGLTRRLEPQDRIDELGDSSVPFDFDIHAMIYSEDAPALENQLHKHFVVGQVNKVNHRKEFFRVDLQHIREEIEKLGITPKWTMGAAAAEYRETQLIEQKMKDNPSVRDAWIRRQLELESMEPDVPETDFGGDPRAAREAVVIGR